MDISLTRMSCCDNQSQADDDSFSKLPRFLTFSRSYRQFDLSRGAQLMSSQAAEEAERSMPSNVL